MDSSVDHEAAFDTAGAVALLDDDLVAALHQRGIRHLGPCRTDSRIELEPVALIAGLASSSDARVRAALVPLFVLRPEHAHDAAAAAARLADGQRWLLMCMYSAAVALQRLHGDRLAQFGVGEPRLSDLFATSLSLPALDDASGYLAAVADRHARLSHEAIDWQGTYEHALKAGWRFVDLTPAWNR